MDPTTTDIQVVENYDSDEVDSLPPPPPPPYEDLDQEVTLAGESASLALGSIITTLPEGGSLLYADTNTAAATFHDNDDAPPPNEDREVTSTVAANKEDEPETETVLTKRHILNLIFCLLAWACTACNNTLGKWNASIFVSSNFGEYFSSLAAFCTLQSWALVPW